MSKHQLCARAITSLLGITCTIHAAFAYEIGTHARLTYEAYARSVLAAPGKLSQLGVPDVYLIFGDRYVEFDAVGGPSSVRRRYTFEDDFIARSRISVTQAPTQQQSGAYRPVGWMMAGAVREDDGTAFLGRPETPGIDNPLNGGLNRFCNHFYDPTKGGNLAASAFSDWPYDRVCDAITAYQSAPAWALALKDGQNIFTAQADANARRNHFTVMDAKEALWRATTGYNGAMTTKVAPFAKDRLAYWATTFRSLGDVVHVLQDMAQPQHTRNEGHPAGGRGAYEAWVEDRVVSRYVNTFLGVTVGSTTNDSQRYSADYFARSGVNIPRFDSYKDYWHVQSGAFGLAQYSNSGFLTTGRNIGNAMYALPSNQVSAYVPVTQNASELTYQGPGITGQWKRTYLLGAVPDALNGASPPIRMTSQLALYRLMTKGGLVPSAQVGAWGHDPNTMNDHAYLQLPRAVAYSAGLIDYFFRGQLKIEPPALGMYAYTDLAPSANTNPNATKNYTFKKLAFKLTNTTPAIAHSATNQILDQSFAVKSLVAVVKFHRNTGGGAGWKPDLSTEYGAPGQSFESNRDKTNSKTAYDINQDESIVISTSCTVDGANPPGTSNITMFGSGVARAIECDFGNEPIPVGSSDLYLQVVARGTLGTEEDAVVVQTIDISEPTTQVDGNGGDWFEVGGQLYRPTEITGTVLQGVRTECRGTTAPNPGCVAPTTLTTLNRVGPALTPFYKSVVPTRRFSRVAFLLPTGTAAAFGSPSSGCGAWPGDTESTTIDADVNQLEVTVASDGSYSSQYHYVEFTKPRGIVNLESCIGSLSASATKPTDFSRFDADLLTTAEQEAVAVIWCIDSPAACLPSANAASDTLKAGSMDSTPALNVATPQAMHFRTLHATPAADDSVKESRKRRTTDAPAAPTRTPAIIQRVSADQAMQ
jgi:hypothetical protein